MEPIYNKQLISFLQSTTKSILGSQDLQNALGFKSANSKNTAIHRFVKNRWLLPIRKGLYANSFKAPEKFAVATAVVSPSYISFESALNYYGILSQNPQVITVATIKKSRETAYDNQIIKYSHLGQKLFFGYQKTGEFLIAMPEKALLDTLYFESRGLTNLNHKDLDLTHVDLAKLREYAKAFPKLCLPPWK
ncbi:MAG: hypothetical protein NT141_01845 [candidate division WWE3 bacterium]|nr:hypothetical protein [candidate division WWE3 bacterium]